MVTSISYETPALWTRHLGNLGTVEGQLLDVSPKLHNWVSRPFERRERRAEAALHAFWLLRERAFSEMITLFCFCPSKCQPAHAAGLSQTSNGGAQTGGGLDDALRNGVASQAGYIVNP
jgi:hypothetical protein